MKPTWNPKTQTLDFTTNNGLVFSMKATKKEVSKALLGDYHQVYNIWIIYNGKRERFTFHDSVHNYNFGREATPQMIYDALECIVTDCYIAMNSPLFSEFVCEFGYTDDQMAEARRAYNGCHNSLRKMEDLFPEGGLEDINDTMCDGDWRD